MLICDVSNITSQINIFKELSHMIYSKLSKSTWWGTWLKWSTWTLERQFLERIRVDLGIYYFYLGLKVNPEINYTFKLYIFFFYSAWLLQTVVYPIESSPGVFDEPLPRNKMGVVHIRQKLLAKLWSQTGDASFI